MKTRIMFLAVMLLLLHTARSQEAINYQAVIRNASNELVANSEIGFEFGILVGGDQVYVERHAVFTDMNGQLALKIGKGTVVSGVFDSIKWGSDYMEILIRCDIDGDAIYDIISTEALNSVPYAHYAQKAVRSETSADNKWTGSDETVYTLSPTASVGIGTITPETKLAVNGAISIAPPAYDIFIAYDDFTIEVGDRSYLKLQSDSPIASDRTILLSDGLAVGQLLIIEGLMTGENFFEMIDDDVHKIDIPSSLIIGNADVITLIWNGARWLGVSYSDNE